MQKTRLEIRKSGSLIARRSADAPSRTTYRQHIALAYKVPRAWAMHLALQVTLIGVIAAFATTARSLGQESSLFHNPLGINHSASEEQSVSQLPQQTGSAPYPSPDGTYFPNRGFFPGAVPRGPSAYQQVPGLASNRQVGQPMRHPSYYYQPPPQKRVLRIHDIVQIRVDESARMTADGIASVRKNGIYDAILEDWIALDSLNRVIPAPQRDGDQTISGQTNQTFRANSQLSTRESLVFNIAAEIADIRPNGNLVLEAHKTITINDNRWELSLTGECQDRAIGPDNTVLSRDLINLRIEKRETGQARDGYKRGWLAEFLGRFGPF